MRTIKFRGKNLKGQWHYGLLCHDKTKDSDYEWFISNSAGKPYAFGAIPETIGQFTGLHDKNGKEIFEGDKLQNPKKEVGEVVFWESGFHLEAKRRNNSIFYMPLNNGFLQNKEIIGNVFENTDLVKL